MSPQVSSAETALGIKNELNISSVRFKDNRMLLAIFAFEFFGLMTNEISAELEEGTEARYC